MARLSATVTVTAVFFLLLIEVAIAGSLYQNNVAVRDTLPLPQSATEPLLRLPSDGVHSFPDPESNPTDVPESNPTDVTESKPISVAVKADEQARDIPDSSPITVRSVPLTSISLHDLRPINRHFPLRMGFRRFPCGHSHPFLQPMQRTARMSSGDDMMISKADEEGGRDSDSESWARSFRLPYHHFHHRHHHHDDGDDGEVEGIPGFVLKHHRFGKEKLSKHWHKKADDDDDQEDDDDDDQEDDDEKEKGEKRKKKEGKEKGEKRKKKKEKEQKGGFVKRVRKFLDHLF